MKKIKEGDLYKVVEIEGRTFEIRYGYYEPELEQTHNEPMPIFPNFLKEPQYTDEGYPFVTGDQDICKHFRPKSKISGEGWCNDCVCFVKHEEYIGVCRCECNKKNE